MEDRRISEKFRKPRRSKGTPFHLQRNYYTLGIFGVSAIFLALYEFSFASTHLRKKQLEGAFNNSEEYNSAKEQYQLARSEPSMESVIVRARERILKKDEESQPKPWYHKYVYGEPEI
ncbi:unnamed protein product [Brassicogethes aeneus]|uniref:Uncharacterized protein n=1 Tax=Brassicogethes aeneus TaxID=1431903 RepID=A0A9P0BK59_BRAAE|nr:unnamed protein product [Brassicogethes aeneus]